MEDGVESVSLAVSSGFTSARKIPVSSARKVGK